MRLTLTRTILAAAAVALTTVAASASPITLTNFSGQGIGTLVATETLALNSATITGSVVEDVFVTAAGTYNFAYQVTDTTGLIENLTAYNFAGYTITAGYANIPANATGFVTGGVDPCAGSNTTGVIGFDYTNGGACNLSAGAHTGVLVVETNATNYNNLGLFNAIDGSTATVAGYEPAAASVTPEPSSLVLLGTGIIGAAGALRRRFVKA